jgi:thioredoxin 1
MTNDFNAVRPPSARRHILIVTVFALAAAAGAISYLLMERATAPAPDVHYVAEVDEVQMALRLGKPAVVEFGANACASCREMKPVLESLEREHGERISVANVDIIRTRGYISRYKIQLMPTQVFFDAQGREIGRNMGKVSAGEILARLGFASPERTP